MLTYREVLGMIKQAQDYKSYLNSPIPKKLPTQTSQQYKQRVTALDPSRARQQDTSTFNAMLGPNHDMLNTNNIMTSPGGTQRQAQTAAAGEGIKDYYKNTAWQQQARNAGAATVGAATGMAKGFLATPFTLANVAGTAMDYTGKGLGKLTGNQGISNVFHQMNQGIHQVTGGVKGALNNVNTAASNYLGAQKGVGNASSLVSEIATGVATPGAWDTVIATKPGVWLAKGFVNRMGNAGRLAPVWNKLTTSKWSGTLKTMGNTGMNQALSAAQ